VVEAGERLNPDDTGASLATVVRLYQLKGERKLADAAFEEMLDNPKDVLAEDVVSTQELTVNPRDRIEQPLKRGEGATRVAVVALFRQPAGTSWRAIHQLPPPDPTHCHPGPGGAQKSPLRLRAILEDSKVEIR
jgi:type VI secretion system protein VasD